MEATRVTPEINNIFKEINDTGGQMAFYSAQFNPLLPKLTQALGEHLLDPPKENRNGLPNLHRQTRRYEGSVRPRKPGLRTEETGWDAGINFCWKRQPTR